MNHKSKDVVMCSPDYFDVSYSINPWMDTDNKVNSDLATSQWNELKNVIEKFLGLNVDVLSQSKGLPDMVFAADQGLVQNGFFIQANFSTDERKGESKIYSEWFKKKGKKIVKLSKDYLFEGGDFLPWRRDKLLAGYGFRTQISALTALSSLSGKDIIPLKLVDPWLYHLDTALTVIDDNTFVWHPEAFSPDSQRKIIDLGVELIEVSRKYAKQFALNSFVCGKKVVTSSPLNGFKEKLDKRGYEFKFVDVSEFIKAGGGVHCLVYQV